MTWEEPADSLTGKAPRHQEVSLGKNRILTKTIISPRDKEKYILRLIDKVLDSLVLRGRISIEDDLISLKKPGEEEEEGKEEEEEGKEEEEEGKEEEEEGKEEEEKPEEEEEGKEEEEKPEEEEEGKEEEEKKKQQEHDTLKVKIKKLIMQLTEKSELDKQTTFDKIKLILEK